MMRAFLPAAVSKVARTKTRCNGRVPLGVVLLCAISAAAACNGASGQGALARYFESLTTVGKGADKQLGELLDQYKERLQAAPEEKKIELFADLLDNMQPLIGELAEAVQTVRPPAAVEDKHSRFVGALFDLEEASTATAAEIRGSKSWTDARQLILLGFVPAALRWDEACRELERVATREGIAGGYACPGLFDIADVSVSGGSYGAFPAVEWNEVLQLAPRFTLREEGVLSGSVARRSSRRHLFEWQVMASQCFHVTLRGQGDFYEDKITRSRAPR